MDVYYAARCLIYISLLCSLLTALYKGPFLNFVDNEIVTAESFHDEGKPRYPLLSFCLFPGVKQRQGDSWLQGSSSGLKVNFDLWNDTEKMVNETYYSLADLLPYTVARHGRDKDYEEVRPKWYTSPSLLHKRIC